ncbi:MAG: hypothetical protein JWM65_2025 [Sphingomonas bacterium]|nr:hypothetical protein [Sphingomonas bacterium]
MASNKSLSIDNLATLGAQRLAELLIEISAGDAGAKRRLRLELTSKAGGSEVAHEVRKRIATIAKSRSYLDWDKVKPLARDLMTQYRAIIEHVAKGDPREALDLLWRFMALAPSVYERCDDSNGELIGVFATAMSDLSPLSLAAKGDAKALAERVLDALQDGDYGQYDGLVETLAEPLGDVGLDHLKVLLIALSQQSPERKRGEEREVIGWGMNGPFYADDAAARQRARIVSSGLRTIATLRGDLDGYIASFSDAERRVPLTAANIAQRLLATDRIDEAWQVIEGADRSRGHWAMFDWEATRAQLLDELGRPAEAQVFRWASFQRDLEPRHLRAYLKKLPDFDDIEAEARAMAHALAYSNMREALEFLLKWPALDRVNRLVLDRHRELNGDFYELLSPAADALESRYPLSATLMRRAMIDFALNKARVKRYPHAARHLAECATLAAQIEDYGPHPTHEAYHHALRAAHGRKTGFWRE